MLFSRLALAAITIAVSHAQKKYWIEECPDEVSTVVEEAREMAQNVLFLRDLLDSKSDLETEEGIFRDGVKRSFQEVLYAILPGATKAELQPIWESYQSLSTATEPSWKEEANVLIYCDNDEHWGTPPPDYPDLRDKAYWDPIDLFMHYRTTPWDSSTWSKPACREGQLAGTYTKSFTEQGTEREEGELIRITLCDDWVENPDIFPKYHSFDILAEKDLSRHRLPFVPAPTKPTLDHMSYFSPYFFTYYWHATNERDFRTLYNSVGWRNIRRIASQGGGHTSLTNIAYLGLAAQIIVMGMDSYPRKLYYFEPEDGTIGDRRSTVAI